MIFLLPVSCNICPDSEPHAYDTTMKTIYSYLKLKMHAFLMLCLVSVKY